MKRVGRLLICIASGVALSVTARGDVTPPTTATPNFNGAYHNTMLRQNTNVINRLMMMKKKHHMNLPDGFPQLSRPAPPGFPQARAPLPGRAATTVAHPNTATATAPDAAAGALSGNPYESIVTRNVFGLNPIPISPPGPAIPPGPPPPKITLTGITTIFGPKEALFKVAGVVRGNGRPQDEYYTFTEGEEQDDVEVTKIDTNKMIVSFINHDVPQDIPLADGVASSGSAPSAPSWPGQPGGRKFPRFRGYPGSNPGFQPQSYNSTYGGGNNSSQNGYNNVFNGNGQQSNYHDLGANISPTVSGLSADDQAALIAAAHAQAVQNNDPTAPMFPPTPFDQEAQKEAGGGTK